MRRAGLAVLAALAVGAPGALGQGDRAPGGVVRTAQGTLRIFPADNPWNRDVSRLPVHPRSADYVASMGGDKPLHADFGTTWQGVPNGIPFVVVGPRQPRVKVVFEYADESDPGPYPVPPDAPVEGGPEGQGDRHVLVVSPAERKLYELYRAFRQPDGSWKAGSGAVFDLATNRLRRAGWTSADAAGLPIFPGLARYEEAVELGAVRHALRVTARRTQRAYIPPATHFASRSTDPALPPMGLRLRLKASVDLSGFPPAARAILVALKTYGMYVADNGADWYLSGAPDPRWKDDELRALRRIRGRDFEAVLTGELVTR